MKTAHIINDKAGILDLSMITDVLGHKVVLKPKDSPGSSREVFESELAHPHVQAVIRHKWAHTEAVGEAKAAEAPAAPKTAPPPREVIVPPPPTPEQIAAHTETVAAKDDLTVKVDSGTMAELAAESMKAEEPKAEDAAPDATSSTPSETRKKRR